MCYFCVLLFTANSFLANLLCSKLIRPFRVHKDIDSWKKFMQLGVYLTRYFRSNGRNAEGENEPDLFQVAESLFSSQGRRSSFLTASQPDTVLDPCVSVAAGRPSTKR